MEEILDISSNNILSVLISGIHSMDHLYALMNKSVAVACAMVATRSEKNNVDVPLVSKNSVRDRLENRDSLIQIVSNFV